jgi:zinc-finger of acetyl-transferase ESCO
MLAFLSRPRSTEPQNPSPIPAAASPAVDISLAAHPSIAAIEPSSKRHKQSKFPSSKPAKQLVQVHLDLGQKNFHSTRCPTCGLVYTPGKESDDRLHAAYHNKAAATPRYSASRGDTIVATDGTMGDIARLSTTAPTKSVSRFIFFIWPSTCFSLVFLLITSYSLANCVLLSFL